MRFEIVLGSYNPEPYFFQKQIESIINQTYTNWICHIVDDFSSLSSQRLIQSIAGNHPNFKIHLHSDNVGVFHNFERGLSYITHQDCIIAFSDQDDIWSLNKLEIIASNFTDDITLVHSDLCIVSDTGNLIYSSCWNYEKRNPNTANIEFLLVHNCVTGCSLAFKSQLLPYILPFPKDREYSSGLLHDWWIALICLSFGKVLSLSDKLVCYRQHQNNVVGAEVSSGSILKHYQKWAANSFRITFQGYWSYRERLELLTTRLSTLDPSLLKSNIPPHSSVKSASYFLHLFLRCIWSKYGGYGSFLRLFILRILLYFKA